MKTFLIISTILLATLIGGAVLFLGNMGTQPGGENTGPWVTNTTGTTNVTPTEPTTGGQGGTSPTVPSETTTITTARGTTLAVNDFTKDPNVVADPSNPGNYYFAGKSTVENPYPPFSVLYVGTDNSITIALLEEPLNQNRILAEELVLQRLGITKEKACSLRYQVSVPYWVNEFYIGKNLGFSFCPGAIAL